MTTRSSALLLPLLVLLSTSLATAGGGTEGPMNLSDVRHHLFSSEDLTLRSHQDTWPVLLQTDEPKRKSVGLAALYSLVLPGLGELYAGGFNSGKYFVIAEGTLWLTFIGLEVHGTALRDDARAFARAHAGIDPRGKGDQFFVDIGNFLSVYDYNEKQLRDREPERLYNPNAGYYWRWDSDQNRATYRDQRVSSEHMFNNQKFVVAAVLINHVASAINAARAAIAHNKSLDESAGTINFRAGVLGDIARPYGILLTMTKEF